jgi:hypothetical protein
LASLSAANYANDVNRRFNRFFSAPARVIRVIGGSFFGCGYAAL